MPNEFRVRMVRTDHATVVVVGGELDLVSSVELEEALEKLDRPDHGSVVLDLREVEFMDSSGLAVVVRAHQRAHSAGITFGVVTESPQVRRLLTLTGVDERMPVAQTPEDLLGGG
ncbi:MAG TPA: STAS domain-containing protein [Solirubrobacteraceae bacterium]|nr:STAS domain-containing protein [Solirubrobacteraceae bacterium]